MSGMSKFALIDGDNKIGKKTDSSTPEVPLKGSGIAPEHCKINFNQDDRTCTLMPNNEDTQKYAVKVNGELVEEPLTL